MKKEEDIEVALKVQLFLTSLLMTFALSVWMIDLMATDLSVQVSHHHHFPSIRDPDHGSS